MGMCMCTCTWHDCEASLGCVECIYRLTRLVAMIDPTRWLGQRRTLLDVVVQRCWCGRARHHCAENSHVWFLGGRCGKSGKRLCNDVDAISLTYIYRWTRSISHLCLSSPSSSSSSSSSPIIYQPPIPLHDQLLISHHGIGTTRRCGQAHRQVEGSSCPSTRGKEVCEYVHHSSLRAPYIGNLWHPSCAPRGDIWVTRAYLRWVTDQTSMIFPIHHDTMSMSICQSFECQTKGWMRKLFINCFTMSCCSVRLLSPLRTYLSRKRTRASHRMDTADGALGQMGTPT